MEQKLTNILGKYKVIGDTTYGLGYEDAKSLVGEIIQEVIKTITTHSEHEGGYCDTGEDMEWACRSKCMDLAVKRLLSQ